MKDRVIIRYKKNPILTRDDIPYPVSTVHNAGVVRHNGRYIMLFRSHLLNGRCVIGLAESGDGYSFTVSPEPFLVPAKQGIFAEYEEYGVEDLRICAMDDEYLLTYSAYSRHGVRIALARTTDFTSVKRIALISQPDMRNVVIFPQKFAGRYARLDRPHSKISPWSIYISYSPDLIHWGDSKVVMKPATYHWDEMKIGPGATPFRTNKGWLHIYHGVYRTMAGAVYRLGAALHDLDNPSRVIGISDDWILEPEDPWERTGYVPNVVFTCGAVPEEDGTVKIYWGGADTVMCAGSAQISDLMEMCLNNSREPY
ncbi:beta-1,4-mannooligosaccharide phosphorylase [bacterium BMS3Abin09]|nr:beta-1,4-mannooligosaccharide phosphorylase [bacterium BMS3Abin09]GBE40765.1 beta-1,4-mannooligosaccharide phosphorylase [bacterium BMS3Bbin09]HDN94762.1 glycosidase [Nitrospirota bacterium]HDO22291.1 glycosidase [Nitrospirota bacterium]HDO67357.1 glycosidase [Nitrospirota bacterium]